jgi:hypothetical protein
MDREPEVVDREVITASPGWTGAVLIPDRPKWPDRFFAFGGLIGVLGTTCFIAYLIRKLGGRS